MYLNEIIYDDELDLYESYISLERAIYTSNLIIDSIYFENSNELSNTDKFKNLIKKIIEGFKVFISKCKDYLKTSLDKIKNCILSAYTNFKLKNIFDNFNENILKAEKSGLKTFKCVDIDALYQCINDEYDEYTKAVNHFVKSYIKHASPKDAEKFVSKFNEMSDKYDSKIRHILTTKKEYNIHEAKKIVNMIENDKNSKNGGFSNIVKKYRTTCDSIEDLTIKTLNSLNSYSDDTGYIQNAKSLQQMIHNSSIRLRIHSAECVNNILSFGIPTLCLIDQLANTEIKYTGKVEEGKIPLVDITDKTSKPHATVRKIISTSSEVGGFVSSIRTNIRRKKDHKNEIKDWKFTKGESPLTFDKDSK